MFECGKATLRRLYHSAAYARYFSGKGIDIGAGNDPLAAYAALFPITSLRLWDVQDGDAQAMKGVNDNEYDFVHSSHCLEHLLDPAEGLRNWVRITKPGGFLVLTFPDEDLYEQGVFPSTINPDHKHTFTICKAASWSTVSVNVTDLVAAVALAAECVALQRLELSFIPRAPRCDQTMTPVGESAIELVLRKRHAT
jgi:SAM-dependent methyltransferase